MSVSVSGSLSALPLPTDVVVLVPEAEDAPLEGAEEAIPAQAIGSRMGHVARSVLRGKHWT